MESSTDLCGWHLGGSSGPFDVDLLKKAGRAFDTSPLCLVDLLARRDGGCRLHHLVGNPRGITVMA